MTSKFRTVATNLVCGHTKSISQHVAKCKAYHIKFHTNCYDTLNSSVKFIKVEKLKETFLHLQGIESKFFGCPSFSPIIATVGIFRLVIMC